MTCSRRSCVAIWPARIHKYKNPQCMTIATCRELMAVITYTQLRLYHTYIYIYIAVYILTSENCARCYTRINKPRTLYLSSMCCASARFRAACRSSMCRSLAVPNFNTPSNEVGVLSPGELAGSLRRFDNAARELIGRVPSIMYDPPSPHLARDRSAYLAKIQSG